MSNSSKIRLSQRAIEGALAAHQQGQRERHWFTDVPGMYLLITPKGCPSYCLRYQRPGGGKGDYTIAKADRITPEMAREGGKAKLAALTLNGIDPCEARRAARSEAQSRKSKTFSGLAEAFLAASENQQRAPRTVSERKLILNKYLLPRLGKRSLDSIGRADIKQCLREILASTNAFRSKAEDEPNAGHRTANKAHEVVRRVFSWGIDEGFCKSNPAAFPAIFDDNAEKRICALNDERLTFFWNAFEKEAKQGWGNGSVLAIQLCALTLQRPNEIVQARNDQFDWEALVWHIPASRTKTNTSYQVPFSSFAAELFKAAFKLSGTSWAFPTKDGKKHIHPNVLTHRFGKTRRRLLDAGKLTSEDVELYDFRRLGRTLIEQRLGFSEHVAERVINHAPNRSMARRYNVGDYTGEIRRAHQAWAWELRRIVYKETPPSNVLQLPTRQAAE